MDNSICFAQKSDADDKLASFREKFFIPKHKNGNDVIYMCGNSLGLMPKSAEKYIHNVLEDWKNLAVEGHFYGKNPWIPYHEVIGRSMASIVGALPAEVVVMNSLTVNIHLLMVSFYRPDSKRNKILFEFSPFPSDRYAIESQVRYHGFDPKYAMIELKPEDGQYCIENENIEKIIHEHGDEIALILIGGVNYYTGQLYDLKRITKMGHEKGCVVGFDLAHGAGNIDLQLHDDGPDFAAWCTYKYLNSGPGSLSGIFIHKRHHGRKDLNRFAGWWGQDKESRFLMGPEFNPMPTAEGWQLSNQSVIQMAAVHASLDIFLEAGMENLRLKSIALTLYLAYLIDNSMGDEIHVITPTDGNKRGCQLSLQMTNPDKRLFDYLIDRGVILDWREPDVIRVAPTPLYNTFIDVWNFCRILKDGLKIL
jgi:kynureninase